MIADSILNLQRLGLINSPEEDPHLTSELRLQGAPLDPPDNEEHGMCTCIYICACVFDQILIFLV